MYKLPKVSYCGIEYNHGQWGSHVKKCKICQEGISNDKKNIEESMSKWDKKCACGCGEITEYENVYIKYHHRKNKNQTEDHKNNRLQSWIDKGNVEKYRKNWTENNPQFSEKNKIRMRENNPAKKESSRKKISENNPMKNPEFKNKAILNRIKKYENNYDDITEKMKSTMIKRYGYDNPAKVKEMLEKRIDTYTKNLSDGKYEIKNNWICGKYLRKNGETEWHDSSFELRKMVQYNTDDIIWTKKHGIRIPYINENGLSSFYVPDFLIEINNNKIIIETKGYVKKSDILKAESCIEWCRNNDYQYYFLLGENLEIVDKYSYICKYIEYK